MNGYLYRDSEQAMSIHEVKRIYQNDQKTRLSIAQARKRES